MLGSRIIYVIFLGLLQQGNIASALPQGDFQKREGYIGENEKFETIEARDVLDAGIAARDMAVEIEGRDEPTLSEHQGIVARAETDWQWVQDLEKFNNAWWQIGKTVFLGVATYYFTKAVVGEGWARIAKKDRSKAAYDMAKADNIFHHGGKQTEADIERTAEAIEKKGNKLEENRGDNIEKAAALVS